MQGVTEQVSVCGGSFPVRNSFASYGASLAELFGESANRSLMIRRRGRRRCCRRGILPVVILWMSLPRRVGIVPCVSKIHIFFRCVCVYYCRTFGTREEPGTLTQGAPVFPGSSRLGIEPKTPGWLVQDPTTRPIGDLIPTIGGSGAHPWRGPRQKGIRPKSGKRKYDMGLIWDLDRGRRR